MIHPLIRLMATRPHLLMDHLSAYAALVGSEMQQMKGKLLIRLVLVVLALCFVGVAVVLTGVSVMLWAVTPDLTPGGRWALVLAPGIPGLAAVIAALMARRPVTESSFGAIQAQLDADARMLTDAGSA